MVDPQHPGRYRCNLGENWNAFFAFGGATLAAAMRATSAHVDHPDLHPVGIHALFLHPVEGGPLVIDVETQRGGRRVQQLSATLHSATGDPALRMQGIWGSHEPDLVTGLGLRFPDVPLPDDPTMAPPEHSPEFGHLPINAQFDERHCPGSAVPGSLLDPERDATSAVWTRLGGEFHSGPTPFDPALLALYADRVPGPHLGRTITGHPTTNVPPRAIVTLELSLRIVGTPSSDWLLLEGSVPQAAGRRPLPHRASGRLGRDPPSRRRRRPDRPLRQLRRRTTRPVDGHSAGACGRAPRASLRRPRPAGSARQNCCRGSTCQGREGLKDAFGPSQPAGRRHEHEATARRAGPDTRSWSGVAVRPGPHQVTEAPGASGRRAGADAVLFRGHRSHRLPTGPCSADAI